MTLRALNTADELKRLIAEGRIADGALQAMTGISGDALAWFLAVTPSGASGLSTVPAALTGDESARLSGLVAQLTEGFQIEDDVRLVAIIETLVTQCQLTRKNIALLTHVALDDLESFMSDPNSVPLETKYTLAIRASYLINAVANAQHGATATGPASPGGRR